MTLYRHIHPTLTREQQEAFVTLGRHLVMTATDPKHDAAEFDIGHTALDLTTGDELTPEQTAHHEGPLACNLLGHAARAGLRPLPHEGWPAYQFRILGAEHDSPLEDWLLSFFWWKQDSTPIGAALRLMYVLDYGVPGDFELIRDGQAESDYRDNGFLWDRLGMTPPDSWNATTTRNGS